MNGFCSVQIRKWIRSSDPILTNFKDFLFLKIDNRSAVRNGTCYTSSECSELQGNGYGKCAAGYVYDWFVLKLRKVIFDGIFFVDLGFAAYLSAKREVTK